ncbi:MAG TPA: putative zinc-binding protein [Fibrobacteria bacterium]|nr:putative zinc-binding protein [Fibrobacteria bacterium]HOX50763.1 putative zinc-binding protein [Fibrobacteria bacterium]
MSCSNCATTPATMIYSCSGAADVGEISDRVARTQSREGLGKMSCAVGVGAGIQSLRNGALSAGRVLAIDGCAVRCVAKAMGEAGVTEYVHIELGSEGFAKGASPASEENVAKACDMARTRLASA